ncbi:CD276 antigen homolog [Polypterus senegalus]|uniref:CD276 antigen homolog n=1 Tax=Polypterus senegalus TaxID=55291 RepID=UPI00196262DA|nr:CD276 antigen homolog [Polypterus senegalus]
MQSSFLSVQLLLVLQFVYVLSENIDVEAGKDVLLPCTFSLSDLPKPADVIWRKMPETEVYSLKNGIETKIPQYDGRTKLYMDGVKFGNFSILLLKTQEADKGEYKCYVARTSLSHYITLTVKDPETPVVPNKKDKASGEEPGNNSVTMNPGKYLTFLVFALFLIQYLGQL